MTDTYQKLYQGQLTTTATALYTAPNAPGSIIKNITITNTTSTATTFQLFIGGSAAANAITPSTWSVPANGMAQYDGTLALGSAEAIYGVAGANSALTIRIDGDQVS